MPYSDRQKNLDCMKKYREAHKAELKKYFIEHYARNRKLKLKYAEEYRKTHPWVWKEEWALAKKRWHDRNKKRRYAVYKIYSKKNPLIMRAKAQRRIALERGAKGTLTSSLMQLIYENNIKFF